MLGLPKSTECNKRIPKKKFYKNIKVAPAMHRIFVEQIQTIYWRNKIAPTTTNLSAGKAVTEVEFIELRLSKVPLDESVLRQIDKEIPYHIVFILEFEGRYQAWTAYKEAIKSGINAFKVGSYYQTDWFTKEELSIRIDGLDLDTVYESIVRQIAGDLLLLRANSSESLRESLERNEKQRELQKRIEALEAKMRKQKQLNRQMEIKTEIEQLRHEMEVSLSAVMQKDA